MIKIQLYLSILSLLLLYDVLFRVVNIKKLIRSFDNLIVSLIVLVLFLYAPYFFMFGIYIPFRLAGVTLFFILLILLSDSQKNLFGIRYSDISKTVLIKTYRIMMKHILFRKVTELFSMKSLKAYYLGEISIYDVATPSANKVNKYALGNLRLNGLFNEKLKIYYRIIGMEEENLESVLETMLDFFRVTKEKKSLVNIHRGRISFYDLIKRDTIEYLIGIKYGDLGLASINYFMNEEKDTGVIGLYIKRHKKKYEEIRKSIISLREDANRLSEAFIDRGDYEFNDYPYDSLFGDQYHYHNHVRLKYIFNNNFIYKREIREHVYRSVEGQLPLINPIVYFEDYLFFDKDELDVVMMENSLAFHKARELMDRLSLVTEAVLNTYEKYNNYNYRHDDSFHDLNSNALEFYTRNIHKRINSKSAYQQIINLYSGFSAEEKLDTILRETISEKSIVFSNCTVEANKRISEFDHIILSNNKVYIIEIKNYKAQYIRFDRSGQVLKSYDGISEEVDKAGEQMMKQRRAAKQIFGDHVEVHNVFVLMNNKTVIKSGSQSEFIHVTYIDSVDMFLELQNLKLGGQEKLLEEKLASVQIPEIKFPFPDFNGLEDLLNMIYDMAETYIKYYRTEREYVFNYYDKELKENINSLKNLTANNFDEYLMREICYLKEHQ